MYRLSVVGDAVGEGCEVLGYAAQDGDGEVWHCRGGSRLAGVG